MTKQPAADEWDQLVVKMGKLTLAAGSLEGAIISMVCRILGKSDKEIARQSKKKWLSNQEWCDKLTESARSLWSNGERKDLKKRLNKIRKLYKRRNDLIHAAHGIVSDRHIHGVPPGSVIDLRTYEIGCIKQEGNVFSCGMMAKRIHLDDIDRLVLDIYNARTDLAPFMELVDNITEPNKSIGALKPKPGKLLSECG